MTTQVNTTGFGGALIPNEGALLVAPGDYTYKHLGAGNFIVQNVLGNQVGPVIYADPYSSGFAKQTAITLAARLNSGEPPDQVF